MKSKIRKRIIAVMLCMAMVLGGSVSTLADDAVEQVEVPQETVAAEEPVQEETPAVVQETEAVPVQEETPEVPQVEAAPATVQEAEAAPAAEQTPSVAEVSAEYVPEAEVQNPEMVALEYEDDEILVRVSEQQAGIIPAGATLKVVPIVKENLETREQYQEVEKKLTEKATTEEYDIAGFLAYDISFVDEYGNKMEPSGEVKVSMEYKKAASPEQLDEETAKTSDVTVMHLEEDENGEVIDVVDLSKVNEAGREENKIETMEVDDTKAVEKTEFATNSFSTFVVTWHYYSYTGWFDRETSIQFVYCDQAGNEFQGKPITADTVTSGNELNLTNNKFCPSIEGKEYVETRVGADFTQSAVATAVGASYSWGWEYFYKDKNGKKVSLNEIPKVYLVYKNIEEAGGGDDGGVLVEPEPSVAKTADRISENTYNINLDISSSIGSLTKKAKLDVLLIVDRSGSMDEKTNNKSRMQSAKEAANNLINTLAENGNLDVNYSLVSFAGASSNGYGYLTDASVDQQWTSSSDTIKQSINRLRADGGTNYEAAFKRANDELLGQKSRSSASQVVIFLTDGVPTFHIGGVGGGNEALKADVENAVKELARMQGAEFFYSIGFGPDFGDSSGNGQKILKHLTEGGTANWKNGRTNYSVDCGTGAPASVKKKMYTASDYQALQNVFKDIAANVTQIACDNVVVSDRLSENLESTDSTQYSFQIINTKTGKRVYESTPVNWGTNQTLTSLQGTSDYSQTADAALKLSSLSGTTFTFDEDKIVCTYPTAYQLSADYTYRIAITNTSVTKEAIMKYAELKDYTDQADAQTGTFSEQWGFYSNVNAEANMAYQVSGSDKKVDFPKPVIQPDIPEVKHAVCKNWEGVSIEERTPVLTELIAEVGDDAAGTRRQLTYADYKLLPENMQIELSDTNLWNYVWTNLPEYYYYKEGNQPVQKIQIQYSVVERMTEEQSALFSNSISEEPGKTTITNRKNSKQDDLFIRVEKTFTGVNNPMEEFPNFQIGVYKDVAGTDEIATRTLVQADNIGNPIIGADGSLTFVWTIPNLEAGTYYVKEMNWDIEGYEIHTTMNGTATANPGECQEVETKASTLTLSEDSIKREPSCAGKEFNIGNANFIVGSLNKGSGEFFVWTEQKLSATERKKIVELIQPLKGEGNFHKITLDNTGFFSTYENIRDGIDYRGHITMEDGILTFDATSQWTMVLFGSYTIEDKVDAEISIVNEYQSKPATIDLQKYGTVIGDESSQLEAIFMLSKFENEAWSVGEEITVNTDVELKDLPAGTYKLEETKAPAGYILLKQPIYFKVDKGVVTLTDDSGTEINDTQEMWEKSNNNDGSYVIKIKNDVLYDLPSAGSIGIYWYTIGGMLLMIAAALILYKSRQKEVLRK